jgi:hypothetical protein
MYWFLPMVSNNTRLELEQYSSMITIKSMSNEIDNKLEKNLETGLNTIWKPTINWYTGIARNEYKGLTDGDHIS